MLDVIIVDRRPCGLRAALSWDLPAKRLDSTPAPTAIGIARSARLPYSRRYRTGELCASVVKVRLTTQFTCVPMNQRCPQSRSGF